MYGAEYTAAHAQIVVSYRQVDFHSRFPSAKYLGYISLVPRIFTRFHHQTASKLSVKQYT
jgi:hypothetical protein